MKTHQRQGSIMGEQFVLDDCIAQQELLNEIAERFNESIMPEKKKMSAKIVVSKITKPGKISKRTSRKNVKNYAAEQGVSNTSSCVPRSHSPAKNEINLLNSCRRLHKKRKSSLEGSCSNESDLNMKDKESNIKRKRTTAEKDENLCPSKLQKPCEALKMKLKKSLQTGSTVETAPPNLGNAEKVEIKDKPRFPSNNICVSRRSFTETLAYPEQQAIIEDEQTTKNKTSDSKVVQDVAMSFCCEDESLTESKHDQSTNLFRDSDCCTESNQNNCHEISNSPTSGLEMTLEDSNVTLSLQRIVEDKCTSSEPPADKYIFANSQEQSTPGTSTTHQTAKVEIPEWMYAAVDCEMVGVGPKGRESVLARCSILDYNGDVLFDEFIKPSETITDYRTRWSGIRPEHMKTAIPIQQAIRNIREILAYKVVIGHSVYHDFQVLGIQPDHYFVRDTARCRQLFQMANLPGRGNALWKLSEALLGRKIQTDINGHCSVEDARATLDLFKLVRQTWEPELYAQWYKRDKGVHRKISIFVDAATSHREMITNDDFLNDRFWLAHVMK